MSDSGADGIRISKLMARRGLCSRREAESWISEGRVTVNGTVLKRVVSVDPAVDAIRVDGQALPDEPEKAYFLLFKPRGTITGRNDPQGRKSVLDFVADLGMRVEPVGRLDYDTEGALLLTNDGDLAHELTHPSRHIPKRYRVKCYREPNAEKLKLIESGKVFLEDGAIKPAMVRVVETTDTGNAWVEVTVTEGRNRLIRRIFEQIRHPVAKLRRESFATISIRNMERGQVRRLTPAEVRRLRDLAEGRKPEKAGRVKHRKGFAKAKPRGRVQNRKRKEAHKRHVQEKLRQKT